MNAIRRNNANVPPWQPVFPSDAGGRQIELLATRPGAAYSLRPNRAKPLNAMTNLGQGSNPMPANPNRGGDAPANTVRLHRVLRAPAERVYRAFLDPDAMARWLPPYGFTGKVHSMDARVGGGYRMSFTNFGTGTSHSFSATYVELTPHERIRHTDQFDDPNLPGQMQVTIELRTVACGTELQITQAGIPAAIPVEFCYLGWQESLTMLAQLVEPEIPDGA